MKLRELIQRLATRRRVGLDHEDNPFPENLESYLEDFVPNVLLKSETLQIAFGVTAYEMEELYNEGYKHYEENRYKDSSTVFRWLILLNPFLVKYWMGLGASQMLLEQHEKALHSFACAAILDCENPYPHFHAFECYSQIQNKEDADKALNLAYQRAKGKAAYQDLVKKMKEYALFD